MVWILRKKMTLRIPLLIHLQLLHHKNSLEILLLLSFLSQPLSIQIERHNDTVGIWDIGNTTIYRYSGKRELEEDCKIFELWGKGSHICTQLCSVSIFENHSQVCTGRFDECSLLVQKGPKKIVI